MCQMMFVSENHVHVTAALDELDRVLTTHFDTKILPRNWTNSVRWRGD